MGTFYNIKIVTKNSEIDINRFEKRINETLDEVNRQMSTYREDSEITGFNNYKDTNWYAVSEDFAYVVEKALLISELSDGAFDITVGPIVNVWGFGPEIKKPIVPDEDVLDSAKEKTGYHYLSINLNPPKIKKDIPDMYIDLSAIAKGFGVDKVCEYLELERIQNYMVEIGGEVRAKGKNHKGKLWQIGIEKPDESGSIEKIVNLTNYSLATSGDYHNYFEVDGIRYSHTIDPRSAMPVNHSLASVSVLHVSCTMADGFATAINVLGPEAGYEFAFNQNLPLFMIIKEEGKFIEKLTPSFNDFLSNN